MLCQITWFQTGLVVEALSTAPSSHCSACPPPQPPHHSPAQCPVRGLRHWAGSALHGEAPRVEREPLGWHTASGHQTMTLSRHWAIPAGPGRQVAQERCVPCRERAVPQRGSFCPPHGSSKGASAIGKRKEETNPTLQKYFTLRRVAVVATR